MGIAWEDARHRLDRIQRWRWLQGSAAKLALSLALGWQLSCWFGLRWSIALIPTVLVAFWALWDWRRQIKVSGALAAKVLDSISNRGALFETCWELKLREDARGEALEAEARRVFQALDLDALLALPNWSQQAPVLATAALIGLLSAPHASHNPRPLEPILARGAALEPIIGAPTEADSSLADEELIQSLQLIEWRGSGQMSATSALASGQKPSGESAGEAGESDLESLAAGGPELARVDKSPSIGALSSAKAGTDQSSGAGRQANIGQNPGNDQSGQGRGAGLGSSDPRPLAGTLVDPGGFKSSALVRRQLEALSPRERLAAARYFGSF